MATLNENMTEIKRLVDEYNGSPGVSNLRSTIETIMKGPLYSELINITGVQIDDLSYSVFETLITALNDEILLRKYVNNNTNKQSGKGKPNTTYNINFANIKSDHSNAFISWLFDNNQNNNCTVKIFKDLLIIYFKNNGQKIDASMPQTKPATATTTKGGNGGIGRKPTKTNKRKRKVSHITKKKRKPRVRNTDANVIHLS